jgi:hypothetical protein
VSGFGRDRPRNQNLRESSSRPARWLKGGESMEYGARHAVARQTSMTCVSSGGDDFENCQSNCMPLLVSMPPLHCCSSSTLRKRAVSLWLILWCTRALYLLKRYKNEVKEACCRTPLGTALRGLKKRRQRGRSASRRGGGRRQWRQGLRGRLYTCA